MAARKLPGMAAKTTAEEPLPIRSVLQMVAQWIGRLGTVWAEGQITELTARGGTVFMTLRDPVAHVSARVTCARNVYEATLPRPVDGARVVVHVKPDFWVNRGSFAFTALEIRPVGIGELLARLRHGVTYDSIAGLRPAFTKDGTVTAANASGINDGAAALVVTSDDWARNHGRTPLARVLSYATVGVEPMYMGMGPVPASKRCLARAGWDL